MGKRTPVFVYSEDAITQAGLEHMLRLRHDLLVVPSADIDAADVAVIGVEAIDGGTVKAVAGVHRDGCPRVAVVATTLDQAGIATADSSPKGATRARSPRSCATRSER